MRNKQCNHPQVIIGCELVGGTSEVVFRRLDVASLEVFFGLKIDHQQFGFISTGSDGCHHL